MNEKKSADGKQNSYKISGIHYTKYMKAVENAIKKVNGVFQVEDNPGTETAYVNSSISIFNGDALDDKPLQYNSAGGQV